MVQFKIKDSCDVTYYFWVHWIILRRRGKTFFIAFVAFRFYSMHLYLKTSFRIFISEKLLFSYSVSSSSALIYLQKQPTGGVLWKICLENLSKLFKTPVAMSHDKSWRLILQLFKKRLCHRYFLVNLKKNRNNYFVEHLKTAVLVLKNSFPYLYSLKTHSVALCGGSAENGTGQK